MKLSRALDVEGLQLPHPGADAIAHSTRLIEKIVSRIAQQDEAIRFDEFMQTALYEPGLGYYSGNSIKFGALGDFVTAPEISPLFGFCLANQAKGLIEQGLGPRVLEFGAGSGRLCGHLLSAAPALENYLILDLGAELKQRQQKYLQSVLSDELFAKIEWLDRLPQHFSGLVLANEVLDAMPVHLLYRQGEWREQGVGFDGERFCWKHMAPGPQTLAAIESIEARHGELPDGYRCEVNLNFPPWFAALARGCSRAVVIIIDYGYEQADFYHPSRSSGTLNCYYQHRLHFDPLILPGLQDITASIDFDACADAAQASGFVIDGLVSQREFLLANGLLEEAERQTRASGLRAQLAISQQVKTLTLPDEMGSRVKVLALQKDLALDLPAMRRQGAHG